MKLSMVVSIHNSQAISMKGHFVPDRGSHNTSVISSSPVVDWILLSILHSNLGLGLNVSKYSSHYNSQ